MRYAERLYGLGDVLDAEPQRPGEDEMAPATRLLQRLLRDCPRAFDVVAGDETVPAQ